MRVGEGSKAFGQMKMMFDVRSVSVGVKRELYSTNSETRGMMMDETQAGRNETEVYTDYVWSGMDG